MLHRASLGLSQQEADLLPVQVAREPQEYSLPAWLPLALSDLVALLCAKPVSRETLLDSWGLHRMAASIRDRRTDSALTEFFGIGRGRE